MDKTECFPLEVGEAKWDIAKSYLRHNPKRPFRAPAAGLPYQRLKVFLLIVPSLCRYTPIMSPFARRYCSTCFALHRNVSRSPLWKSGMCRYELFSLSCWCIPSGQWFLTSPESLEDAVSTIQARGSLGTLSWPFAFLISLGSFSKSGSWRSFLAGLLPILVVLRRFFSGWWSM